MNLIILEKLESPDLNSFVLFWSNLYSFSNEKVYANAINKNVLTAKDIQDFYVWKNGMVLSGGKQKSLDIKIKAKLKIINDLKLNASIDLEAFRDEFKDLTAVWKIFLLHIIKPNIYPIYDQHIHRAFLFIHKKDYSTISNTSINNFSKEDFYFKEYLPFLKANNIKDIKKLDEAFFAFGQFLKIGIQSHLFN